MLTGKCKTDFEEWYHKFIVDNLDNKENYVNIENFRSCTP